MRRQITEATRFVKSMGMKNGNLKPVKPVVNKDTPRTNLGSVKVTAPSKTSPMQIGRIKKMK